MDTYSNQKVEPIYPVEGGMSELNFKPGLTIAAGTVLGQATASAAVNEVQTITPTSTCTGGTFGLTIAGVDGGTYSAKTAAGSVLLPWNITNAALKISLDALLLEAGYGALDGIVAPAVAITNGPVPLATTITFSTAGGGAGIDWPLMVIDTTNITGGGSLAMVATTAGVTVGLWEAYVDSTTVAQAIAVYSFRTDNLGRVVFGGANSVAQDGLYSKTAPAWFKGRFKTADLTGLDANGVADLGRLESGTVADGIVAIG